MEYPCASCTQCLPAAPPAAQDVLQTILHELLAIPTANPTERAAALQLAQQHAQHSLFAASMGATLLSAAQHVFMPDMRAQHIEYAKSILVRAV